MKSWTLRYGKHRQVVQDHPRSSQSIGPDVHYRFVATYLFIKVKGSRPMTFQYLTVDMVKTRKWGFHGSEKLHDCRKVRLKLFDSDRDEHARTRWLHNICQTLAKPQCTLFWSLEMAVNTENCRLHEQIGVRRDRKLRSSDHSGNAKCRLLAATEQRVFSEDQMHTILP